MVRKRTKRDPALRFHKTGQWFVRIRGVNHYLGRDEEAANIKRHELLLQYRRTGEVPAVTKQRQAAAVAGDSIGC